MIRWPWVSRSTLDEVRGERDRLRAQNDELCDQLIRLKRVQNGRPELKPQRKKTEPVRLPDELKRWIAGWDNADIREQLRREAHAELRRGTKPGALLEKIKGRVDAT